MSNFYNFITWPNLFLNISQTSCALNWPPPPYEVHFSFFAQGELQVSLAIRGGYVPNKISNREYQNQQFRLKLS